MKSPKLIRSKKHEVYLLMPSDIFKVTVGTTFAHYNVDKSAEFTLFMLGQKESTIEGRSFFVFKHLEGLLNIQQSTS